MPKTITDFDAYVSVVSDLIWDRFNEDKTMTDWMRQRVKEKIKHAVIDVSVDRAVRAYFHEETSEAIVIGRLKSLRPYAVPAELKELDEDEFDPTEL